MDVADLRCLCAAADSGNFARAAEVLRLNTSTISRRIARLEDELGLTLFERGRFGIRLTTSGREVMIQVRRALAALEAVTHTGRSHGGGTNGEVRLGVRMPPVGEPLRTLLADWREQHPSVDLDLFEMNERELGAALGERRLDAALMTPHALWAGATSVPIYRERLVAALPSDHGLAAHDVLKWALMANETILVQGWEETQGARELYASLLGGARFRTQAASKQSILALVAAGFGITLAVASQSEVAFPNVTFKPIDEPNAWVRVDLTWLPEIEEPAVGRFVAFMRDEARSRQLF